MNNPQGPGAPGRQKRYCRCGPPCLLVASMAASWGGSLWGSPGSPRLSLVPAQPPGTGQTLEIPVDCQCSRFFLPFSLSVSRASTPPPPSPPLSRSHLPLSQAATCSGVQVSTGSMIKLRLPKPTPARPLASTGISAPRTRARGREGGEGPGRTRAEPRTPGPTWPARYALPARLQPALLGILGLWRLGRVPRDPGLQDHKEASNSTTAARRWGPRLSLTAPPPFPESSK